MTDELILQAVARGWCSPENAHKEMDVVLADAIAREVLATLPAVTVGVKPLEWHDCADGSSHDDGCQYEVARDGKYWRLLRGVTGGTSYMRHTDTLVAAQAAAQADYNARILAALTPTPVDASQAADPAVNAPDPAAIREAALREAADAINERGKREQEDFGLNRATQNFYRARDLVRSLIAKGAAE